MLLVTLLGVLLYPHWDWRAAGLALILFCVIRPLSVYLLMGRRWATPAQRTLIGWFGIRGIGSLYYLSYALNHGLTEGSLKDSIDITLTVVTISILLHGVTTQPLLDRYERKHAKEQA